ncbi:hypothetical protein JG687_00014473 [Phytophthora cactorum]|uniref:Uncharacterized protein n=1 Tax=Phytophthora cactorum TaxID=29920 RepID=A0A8T1U0S6_9STRA|nr:hypothetical protein GQ600_24836 [Phytophthora cactorum]KAG6950060.1 hypothetical protein JG687_00014473 [Phytophthora cactorum]
MCSNYYDGVVSQYQVQSVIAGKIIPHKSRKNDGLVEFQSCAAGLSESLFGDSYEYRFYAPRLNHADTAFLTHDGLFKDSQKPFKCAVLKSAYEKAIEGQRPELVEWIYPLSSQYADAGIE